MWRGKAKGKAIICQRGKNREQKKSAVLRAFYIEEECWHYKTTFFSFTNFFADGEADHAFQAARGFIFFNN